MKSAIMEPKSSRKTGEGLENESTDGPLSYSNSACPGE